MCGRYTLVTPGDALAPWIDPDALPELAPRYNIAPTQEAPVVRTGSGERLEAAILRWGLVPAWARDASGGGQLINARAETAAEKPAFRDAVRARRCLVPADGFYEWRREGRVRQPYRVVRDDGRPFVMAGVWERWGSGGEALETFAVLTRPPTPEVADLHDRMPLILDGAAGHLWLGPADDAAELLAEVSRRPPPRLVPGRVSTWVNDVAHEGPDCVAGPEQRSLW